MRLFAKGGSSLMKTFFDGHLEPAPAGKYRHWDTLRHLTPPAGLTSEQWWMAVKLSRAPLLKTLPLSDSTGCLFRYAVPDVGNEMLHFIDREACGRIASREPA